MNYITKYTHLSFGELFETLIEAYDHRQCFADMHDWNMHNAWSEQIEFILEEFKRRGWLE